jgi:AcrR family transcriptional regulator
MSTSEALGASAKLTRKGQATRDRIVTAAARLMHERGVAGTSTEDVQLAAGVSPSQIYHYFGDKRALVHAVIARHTEVILAVHESRLTAVDSVAGLRAWRDFIVEMQRGFGCRDGCPLGSLGSELAESDPAARDAVAAAYARWVELIAGGLHTMRERGELAPNADPDRLALAVLTALQGGLLLTQTYRDTAPLEAALDTVLDHVESLTR